MVGLPGIQESCLFEGREKVAAVRHHTCKSPGICVLMLAVHGAGPDWHCPVVISQLPCYPVDIFSYTLAFRGMAITFVIHGST